jgi:hypothetical protein
MGTECNGLISGLDTVQAAYYLRPHLQAAFRFEPLMVSKERLRGDKNRKGTPPLLSGRRRSGSPSRST